MRRYIK